MLLKGFFNLTEIFSINFQRLTEIASELSILLNDTKRSFSAQQNSDPTYEYTKRAVVNAGRHLLLLHTLLPLIVRFFLFLINVRKIGFGEIKIWRHFWAEPKS